MSDSCTFINDSGSFVSLYDRLYYDKAKKFHWKPTIINGTKYWLEYSYSVTRTSYEDINEYTETTWTNGHRAIKETFTVMKAFYALYEADRLWQIYKECNFMFIGKK